MNRKLKWGLLGSAGIAATALAYAGSYFYKTAVAISKKDFIADMDMEEIVADDPWTEEKQWYQSVEKKTLTIRSTDNLTLAGLLIPQAEETQKVAIIAHGYNGSNKDMAPWAKLYYDLGFSLLLPDARGHGDSEGDYIGFGWHERMDYLKWIDQIIEKFGQDVEVILYGLSMGAATVMNVSGETLPSNVKAIIEDCGYSSVSKEMAHQLKTMYKLPQYPFIPMTSLITKVKAGYWFGEASPEEQVKKATTPMLFIHGDEDDFVPTHMAYELYHSAASPKELYIAVGAKHGYAYVADKVMYQNRVKHFLNLHMKDSRYPLAV
ncbi:hydrolase of the alpha/beta superfamily [Alkalibacterium sp. AK22]|uniref:alpha/beta hydrolase n=1 Tax=Alkalibacterium sp. AK22 TaxID=1229520 RepID=UPI00044A69A5|nr:alpha/beta hydrolase [Alkalibacterium sp. AK22]EXJ23142.1 hydrolase of the alpha/beta superfamily [Alkalibacterium sp. AK22]